MGLLKWKMILALTGEMQQRVKNWGQGYKDPPYELLLSGEKCIKNPKERYLT